MDLRLSVLEFFRGLAHRIRLGSSKTRSNRFVSKLEFESHPPPRDRKAEEKVYGNETGWMDRYGSSRGSKTRAIAGRGAVGGERSSIDL